MRFFHRFFRAVSSARRFALDFFWLAGLCFGGSLHFFCPAFPAPEYFFSESAPVLSALIPFCFWPTVSILIASVFSKQMLLCVAFVRGMVCTFVWCMLWGMLQPLGWFLSSCFMAAELLLNPLLFLLWKHLMTYAAPLFLLYDVVAVVLISFLYIQLVMPISVFLIKDLLQEFLS